MFRYATTIFLSAFLLFQIQPMIAKFILPWFGGSAAVWTTSMMFFQIVLLLGYLYAHLMKKFFRPRTVWLVHIPILVLAALTLKQSPPEYLKPTGGENLTLAVVWLLATTVGMPFFVLSSTGPLIQAWHSQSHGLVSTPRQTYRLYALSNAGSIFALVSYPFLFEPVFPLQTQTTIWSIGFVLFAVVCLWSGQQTIKFPEWRSDQEDGFKEEADGRTGETEKPRGEIAVWLLLAMTPSILLLAVTNLLCQEVASVPFLWILPLSLYLVSLIICFDRPALYQRAVFWPAMIIGVVGSILLLHVSNQASLLLQVTGYSISFFACCMCCHGELERLKPARDSLTHFYLMVSTGGALGGVFVVVVAPQIFTDYCEFHVGLLLCLILPAGIKFHEALQSPHEWKWALWSLTGASLLAATCVLCSMIYFLGPSTQRGIVERIRNEYGLVYVRDLADGYRIMVNGRTEHGGQFLDIARQMEPNGYYTPGCGPSLAIAAVRQNNKTQNRIGPLKIGVLGLGTGSLVTWGEKGDQFIFYEINPASEKLARAHFTYLENWGDDAQVILGDGRIQLERSLAEQGSQGFDLLFLDAFTSDSIPAHLMTRESFELYLKHLKPGGILVAHITNRFVDLRPVVRGLAEERRLEAVWIEHYENSTDWVLMSTDPAILRQPTISDRQTPWPKDMKKIVWTDNFTSLAQVVDWSFRFSWNRVDPNDQDSKPPAANPPK